MTCEPVALTPASADVRVYWCPKCGTVIVCDDADREKDDTRVPENGRKCGETP